MRILVLHVHTVPTYVCTYTYVRTYVCAYVGTSQAYMHMHMVNLHKGKELTLVSLNVQYVQWLWMSPVQCVPPSPLPLLIADSDEYVKKNMATLIREIVKHSPEVCI